MVNEIYTIGFTKKTAEKFFELLINNNIDVVIDIRLNNTSQLAAFSKYPDIEYFLKKICNIKYIHDTNFAPEESTLKKYKKSEINWEKYVEEFELTMSRRKITRYIKDKYSNFTSQKICLLCSEPTVDKCHRGLVSKEFVKCFNYSSTINL